MQPAAGDTALDTLVTNLRRRFEQAEPPLPCDVLQTHISIVLLAGERAFKFKKAVDLGFLDFSTLARRHEFCLREVELNRRFAPALYLGVVPVTGTVQAPELDGTGEPIEYAVAMQRFADELRLDRLVEAGNASVDDFRCFGRDLAAVHAAAAPAAPGTPFGTVEAVRAQIDGAFEYLDAVENAAELRGSLGELLESASARIEERRATGRVKPCHGDLHLSNVVCLNGRMTPFDCIEFSDDLSVIDTFSDVAFLIMDLDLRERSAFANVFLNAYLAAGGDYGGVALLRIYCAYRSLVRAKVAEIQRRDATGADAVELARRRCAHARLALDYLRPAGAPGLLIACGLSGSGKTRFSRALAQRTGYVHVRSDVERRRISGLEAGAKSGSGLDAGLYAASRSEQTYTRLLDVAEDVLGAGLSVVVDATFLRRAERERFRLLAERVDAPFTILCFEAPASVLRERISARLERGDDASEATLEVLQHQIATREALSGHELDYRFDASGMDADALEPGALAAFGRLRPGSALPPARDGR